MQIDPQQDIFLKRPVSEKPGEDGDYFGLFESATGIQHSMDSYKFKDGTWLEYDYEDNEWLPSFGSITHWLQPMKLVDVLAGVGKENEELHKQLKESLALYQNQVKAIDILANEIERLEKKLKLGTR